MGDKTKPRPHRGPPLFSGQHGQPCEYITRLVPPDHCQARLYVDSDDADAMLTRELCWVCDEFGGPLAAVCDALWAEGAHPDSKVVMWFGSNHGDPPTPDGVMETTIAAAVPEAYEVACRKLREAQLRAQGDNIVMLKRN